MKKLLASLGIGSTLVLGGVDASRLEETPIDRVETIANERVEAKQVGNVVETTLPWKGEQGIKVSYDMGEPTIEEKFSDTRKKQVITETVTDFEGGFKVDIKLSEKPDTNVFCYAIQGAENYDFFYQPPLTAEEIAEGGSRPSEIEGSYAVYHKTLANHIEGKTNYATGKVVHIPRPQVWEIGNEAKTATWADLSYENEQLCVTVPQDFLDKAEYPVRIDPTFGFTSIGGSSSGHCFTSADSTRRQGTKYTHTTDATLDSISVYYDTTGNQSVTTYAALNIDGVTSHTQVALIERSVSYNTAGAWETFTASSEAIVADDYVLNSACDGFATTQTHVMFYDTVGSTAAYSETKTGSGGYAASKESPWVASDAADFKFSIYATYTAAATAQPPRLQLNSGRMQINSQLKVQP